MVYNRYCSSCMRACECNYKMRCVCVNANADDVCERVRMRLVGCDDDESMVKIRRREMKGRNGSQ